MQPKWQVQLSGHNFDLEELHTRLAGLDPTVVKDGDNYVLIGSALDRLDDPDEVRRAGTEILGLINGLAALTSTEFQPVSVNSLGRKDTGDRHVYVTGVSARARAGRVTVQATGADGSEKQGDPAEGSLAPFLEVAGIDGRVRRVAEILARGEPTWFDLYNVLDAIQEDVGGGIHAWTSERKLKRFSRTARNYSVLGPDARHAYDDHQPQPDPITFEQARDLILRVANSWVTSKLPRHDPTFRQ